ncbi:MAG: hypothetical protein Q9M50_08620 [Methylococcales bacterium]|nr:hypothetical protein [Methylococcales bacterium]
MKNTRFNVMLLLLISLSVQAKEGTDAVTEKGQGVVLYSNGTWAFKLEPTLPLPVLKKVTQVKKIKTTKAVERVKKKPVLKGKRNAYKISYDDTLWVKTNSNNKDADIQLTHKKGNGYAMVIFDRTPVDLEALKKEVLITMRSVASKVEIISAEKKRVKGHQIMVLKINSVIEDLPFSYFNYYASGKWGTVQFVTYTATALMADYEADFKALLNGLVIK